MKFICKWALPFSAVLLFAVAVAFFSSTRIVRLTISPQSIKLAPGETIQLSVTGYLENGETVPLERVEKSGLVWHYRSTDNSFHVDENGLLTGLFEGSSGNVSVSSNHGKINSAPITVRVISPS